jgi:hypothetical protein
MALRVARKEYRCEHWRPDSFSHFGGLQCPRTISPGDIYLNVSAAPWQDGAAEIREEGRWVRKWRVERMCLRCAEQEYHVSAYPNIPGAAALARKAVPA